jgi:sporulation protein YlmC with PRC-barrel domain
MLQLSGTLTNLQVMSLRTGGVVATASEPIINPVNLRIEGWYCADKFSKNTLILLSQDVRDFIKRGVVVNDHDVLSHASELVRLKDVLDLKFTLIGKPVVSDKQRKLGKLTDYAVEMETLYVQKLYASQSVLKSFSGGTLSIDRGQIVEINNKQVIIQDPLQPTKASIAAAPVAG